MASTVTIDLRHVARGLDFPLRQVQAVVELLDEGNTVPFITRYRKDQTGGLDEEQIREIQDRLSKMRLLAERKQTILRSIEAQGKLTEKLAKQILGATTTKRLEDLYLPFKPKKQTLATLARSRGLEELATEILEAAPAALDLDARARDFANPDRQVPSGADAMLGAGHILAEQFSERAELRQRLREILQKSGKIVTTRIAPEPAPAAPEAVTAAAAPEAVTAAAAPEAVTAAAAPEAATAATAPEAATAAAAQTAPDEAAGAPTEAPVAPGAQPEIASSGNPNPNEAAAIPQESEIPAATSLEAAVAPSIVAEVAEVFAESEAVAETSSSAASNDAALLATSQPDGASNAEGATTTEGATAASSETAPALADAPSDEASAGISAIEAPAAPLAAAARRARNRERAKAQKQSMKDAKKRKAEERRIKAFRDYFDYSEDIKRIPPHRVLAINRAERAKVLRVRVECDLEAMNAALDEILVPPEHPHADYLRGCARDALSRLILPALEREARRELTDHAELHAVSVFARNLRNLLLQAPVHNRRVLAADPGFKSGCKLAAIDQFGNLLGHEVIFLVGNKPERKEEAKQKALAFVKQHELTVVAIGNGTACRETEEFFAELIGNELKEQGVAYVIVNEAGASVYSTSQLGREEFPEYDATLRGAVSIGRRLLDPLSELVKIDPANIGVGLYQHDVKAKHLETSLDEVVESCVNYVGVDVNTASPALLRYVSGLNQLTARRVYEYRREHGPFRSREQLREVAGFGEATFVQAAGFLKIAGGDNPLDATWIHPESYAVAAKVLERFSGKPSDLTDKEAAAALAERMAAVKFEELAKTLVESELKSELKIIAEVTAPPEKEIQPPAADSAPAPATGETASESPDVVAEAKPAIEVPHGNGSAPAAAAPAAPAPHEPSIGALTLRDILAQLARPGRDPRDDLPPPVFKQGVLKLEDLTAGMELTGTVLNVVDFGCFVDIGMHDSGLVHVSRLADRFIRDPHEVVAVGDIVRVWVMEVDKERRRVSLTMVRPGSERPRRPAGRGDGGAAAQEMQEGHDRGGGRRGNRPPRSGQGAPGGRPQGQQGGAQGPGPRQQGARPQGARPQGGRGDQNRPPQRAGAQSGSGAQSGPGGQGASGGHARGDRRGYGGPPSRGRRPQGGGGPPRAHEFKPKPKPIIPLSDAMKKGKEPMRTFGDLMQFFQGPPDAAKPGGKDEKARGTKGPGKQESAAKDSDATREPAAPTGMPAEMTVGMPVEMPADAPGEAPAAPTGAPLPAEPMPPPSSPEPPQIETPASSSAEQAPPAEAG